MSVVGAEADGLDCFTKAHIIGKQQATILVNAKAKIFTIKHLT